jgi:WD40 repeat protein
MCKISVLRAFDTGRKMLHAFAVDTVGKTAALGSYHTSDVMIVNLDSGDVIQKHNCCTGRVLNLFYAAGELYCVSKNNRELSTYLVNVASGARTKLLTGKNFDAAACIYPHKAALSWARQIVVINLEDMSIAGHLEEHKDSIVFLAFDVGGSLLVSASADGTAKLWDVGELKCLRTFRLRARGGVALSPNGDLLAIGGGIGRIDLWCLNEDRHLSASTEADCVIPGVCFSEDGKRLYTGDWNGRLSIWDVQRD